MCCLWCRATGKPGSWAPSNIPRTLVLADAEAIDKQVPSVDGVAPEASTRKLVTYRNRNANINVVGTSPAFLTVRSFEVARGASSVIWICSATARSR
jgi:hypothetical protein